MISSSSSIESIILLFLASRPCRTSFKYFREEVRFFGESQPSKMPCSILRCIDLTLRGETWTL